MAQGCTDASLGHATSSAAPRLLACVTRRRDTRNRRTCGSGGGHWHGHCQGRGAGAAPRAAGPGYDAAPQGLAGSPVTAAALPPARCCRPCASAAATEPSPAAAARSNRMGGADGLEDAPRAREWQQPREALSEPCRATSTDKCNHGARVLGVGIVGVPGRILRDDEPKLESERCDRDHVKPEFIAPQHPLRMDVEWGRSSRGCGSTAGGSIAEQSGVVVACHTEHCDLGARHREKDRSDGEEASVCPAASSKTRVICKDREERTAQETQRPCSGGAEGLEMLHGAPDTL